MVGERPRNPYGYAPSGWVADAGAARHSLRIRKTDPKAAVDMSHNIDVPGDDPAAMHTLAMSLSQALVTHGAPERPVVFACIGTDRSTGDALGPLVGQWLIRSGYDDSRVMGTLEHPLHALNLRARLDPLTNAGQSPLVVAIDAALGPRESIGIISLRSGGLRPGHGVGKSLPAIGELAITATVNIASGGFDAHVLQSTRLYVVQSLAKTIGIACCHAMHMTERITSMATPEPAIAA
jgi:putative sporulation protein YyaC